MKIENENKNEYFVRYFIVYVKILDFSNLNKKSV